MASDYHPVDVERRYIHCEREVSLETRTIQCPAHTDQTFFRNARFFQSQVSHGVHRVGNHDHDRFRRIFQKVFCNSLYDSCIDADQFFAGHSRLTRQPRSDHNHIRAFGFLVIVRRADGLGIESQQGGCLVHIQ
ncbi:hypothetical protein D3C87_1433800 [compost metagenome]